MLKQLQLQDFLILSKTHRRVVVFREIFADKLTPMGIMLALQEEHTDMAILESALQRKNAGRYSFLAFGLEGQCLVKQGRIEVVVNQQRKTLLAEPLSALRDVTHQLQWGVRADVADLITSAMGFITYDAIRLFEAIPDRHKDELQLPDIQFNYYRHTLMFDHQEQKLLIAIVAEVTENPEQAYQQTMEAIEDLKQRISVFPSPAVNASVPVKNKCSKEVSTDLSDEQFAALVERVKGYIVAGDAFQIVISRSFKKAYTAHPLDIYRALRTLSPTPYMFYLPIENGVVMGASPEKLVAIHKGEATLNPIAGTRKRTEDLTNQEIEQDLLNDPKEIAEHMMLVDLARNDLGAVCEPGTIHPIELMHVKHFSHVSHIASVIAGKLSPTKDAFDALRYAFPAGTLSGAPKIRAMEIIDELEVSRRGLYGGAICRLDYQGNLDTCIAIRMAVLKKGVATIRAGAGVVYDSDPIAEANETRHKAQAVLDAMLLAEGGL